MNRPARVVAVAGTGTEVGKTWVTAAVAATLRADGVVVGARKPAQSFAPGDEGRTDAEVLANATGEVPMTVCPAHRWYPTPMAPPMAADALGRAPFTVADLAAEVAAGWPVGVELGFVELAGGVRSPMADDGDGIDLLRLLAPDVVLLVADAALGTINAVRLTADALFGTAPVVVFANRYDDGDDLQRRNVLWLRDRCALEVVTDVATLSCRLAPPP